MGEVQDPRSEGPRSDVQALRFEIRDATSESPPRTESARTVSKLRKHFLPCPAVYSSIQLSPTPRAQLPTHFHGPHTLPWPFSLTFCTTSCRPLDTDTRCSSGSLTRSQLPHVSPAKVQATKSFVTFAAKFLSLLIHAPLWQAVVLLLQHPGQSFGHSFPALLQLRNPIFVATS